MQLFAFGINHQTAPLSVREQVVFHAETLVEALRDLVDRRPVKEAAIISTCNRTEIYCNTEEPPSVVDWLAGYHRLKPNQIEPYLLHLSQERAVKHAFRVASGLDSMVLGEPQILGQFKQAVRTAQAAGTLGLLLNKLFQRTFSVAKAVRSE
ncbi:MAG: glutamyl-tRNA reductase, partial [Betaproteobacteria bacterium]|nr:glutamyl-tRNA reductase [Betaproteobacteria bacterium]